MQELWADKFKLVGQGQAVARDDEPFIAVSLKSYAFITVNGLRYGVTNKHRGHGYRHAYIYGRQPVQIYFILSYTHERQDPTLPALEDTFALVKRFILPDDMPVVPWHLR